MTKAAMTLTIAALLAHAAVVSADDETASAAFKRGKAAFKAGRVHEACQAFEASDKLDAKVETELSLAECYEQDGRPVSAAHLYRAIAEKDTNAGRRKTSTAKADKLEAKAPKLRIVASQRPDGLVIKVDGVEVTTGDVMVDVGPHEVTATAPGFEGHASPAVDGNRPIVDVILRVEAIAPPEPPAPPPAPAPEPTPPPAPTPTPPTVEPTPTPMTPMDEPTETHHKRNGVIIGAAGVVVLVGAAVLLDLSSNNFNTEHNLCPNAVCPTNPDVTTANSELSNGHTERGFSIGMGIGGVVLLGVGAYFLLAPDSEASHIAFKVGSNNGELTYTGHF